MGLFGQSKGEKILHNNEVFEQRRQSIEEQMGQRIIENAVVLEDLHEMKTAFGKSGHPSLAPQIYNACMNVLVANGEGRVQPPLSEEQFHYMQGQADTYATMINARKNAGKFAQAVQKANAPKKKSRMKIWGGNR